MAAEDARPSFAVIADWVEGRLDADAAAAVAERVAEGDARLLGAVAWMRGFLRVAKAVPLHTPPPIVRQNLRQHFARWSQARAALDQRPTELVAMLQFDSRHDLALVGLRAADDPDDPDDSVHLAFTTAVADLVLDLRRLPSGRVRMDGQVLLEHPSAAPIFQATATGPGVEQRALDGDELGRFGFAELPEQVTRLRVTNGEVVLMADLDLVERGAE